MWIQIRIHTKMSWLRNTDLSSCLQHTVDHCLGRSGGCWRAGWRPAGVLREPRPRGSQVLVPAPPPRPAHPDLARPDRQRPAQTGSHPRECRVRQHCHQRAQRLQRLQRGARFRAHYPGEIVFPLGEITRVLLPYKKLIWVLFEGYLGECRVRAWQHSEQFHERYRAAGGGGHTLH